MEMHVHALVISPLQTSRVQAAHLGDDTPSCCRTNEPWDDRFLQNTSVLPRDGNKHRTSLPVWTSLDGIGLIFLVVAIIAIIIWFLGGRSGRERLVVHTHGQIHNSTRGNGPQMIDWNNDFGQEDKKKR
jgi:hypothetical protein